MLRGMVQDANTCADADSACVNANEAMRTAATRELVPAPGATRRLMRTKRTSRPRASKPTASNGNRSPDCATEQPVPLSANTPALVWVAVGVRVPVVVRVGVVVTVPVPEGAGEPVAVN